MNPVNVLTGIVSALNNYLNDKLTQQWGRATQQALSQFAQFIIGGFNGLVFARQQEGGAVAYSDTYAQKIATDIVQAEASLQSAISHVAFTLVPHSLLVLSDNLKAWAVAYFSPPITQLYGYVESLQTSRLTDEQWLYGWIVPHVRELLAFEDAFYKGDQPSLNVLIDWLRNPADFGSWAAAPIVGPLVAYLGAKAHDRTRDDLADIILTAWREQPGRTLDAIEAWLVQPIK